jgi:hydroxymethylpyrimidine/phosphomethylpyrimidine kinase
VEKTDLKSATSSESPRLLVVAGKDSSGGAGVDADLEAARWAGASAVVVVTAETQQGPGGLVELGARRPGEWAREAELALEAGVDAVKIGLLPGAEHVEAAAELIRKVGGGIKAVPVVVDPVLAPTLGGRFLDEGGVEAFKQALIPTGCVLTPNLEEAAELTGRASSLLAEHPQARLDAAQELMELGAAGVLLKGGHAEGELLELVCAPGVDPEWLSLERRSGSLRGTGCRHSTAVAVSLARGLGLLEAAGVASAWIGSLIGAQGAS